MKSNIQDFPSFRDAVQSKELVYLFGTGISSALTGKPYSWWKWIMDGISYIKNRPLAEQYEDSLKADDSTDNMIHVVGLLLKAAKDEGTYHSWMKTSFETNPVSNHPLAETLKKLLLPQDVFATTNYDLLLEQATGLGTLSYEDPDKAFPMLDQKRSSHVLHIHGVYDSVKKIDNIVADQAQYEALLENEGAQFIQHILGTRTLIFVGCGKTTEDANIARFLSFAKIHLKMDQDYYFLYKKGQVFEGMPHNIQLIPYGDEYTDLTGFLEDLAQERLRSLVQSHPLIGRSSFQEKISFPDPLTRYHFFQEAIPFAGREKERGEIRAFLQSPAPCSWWTITGQAGAGKSRLALQCIRELPPTWFGFFLDSRSTPGDAADFKPFSHTFAIIDYVSGREYPIAGIMENLKHVFENTPYSLRILLLERENNQEAGSWYSRLLQRFGKYSLISTDAYRKEFLDLGDLSQEAVDSFIGAVCSAKGLPSDPSRDAALRKAYGQKFEKLQFRPLYVQIFVESWIENGFSFPRYDTFEDLLQNLLSREQERWLSLLDGDQPCCNSLIRLLIRANISGRLDIRNLPDLYRPDWEKIHAFLSNHTFPGKQRQEAAKSLICSVCQNSDQEDAAIVPLFPDLIKEYMFFYYMDESRISSVMSEIWQNAAHDFSLFITRCLTDFPKNDFYRHALNVYEGETHDLSVLQGRLELLKKRILHENDDPHVLQQIIDNEYIFWKDIAVPQENPRKDAAGPAGPSHGKDTDLLAALKVSGLHLVARQYGGWSLYDVSQMMDVIGDMLAVPGGKGAEFLKQLALQEHIKELSQAGFSHEALYLEGKMNCLLQGNPENGWNALLKMQNGNAAMMNHLLTDDFWHAASVFKKMVDECRYESPEAVECLAHSCFNIEHFSFLMQKEKYRGLGLEAAQKLAVLLPENEKIRLRLLGCKTIELQWQYLTFHSISQETLLERLDGIEQDLAAISLGDPGQNEAFDMSWGVAKTLKINAIQKEEGELKDLIEEAMHILDQYPRLSSVLTTCITAVHALHKNVLKDKVSHDETEQLFHYVELNYDSESARNAFFALLKDSEDAGRRTDYITKPVALGARQDARYSPFGSGLEEFDEEADFLKILSGCHPQETFRREHPKTGANDPCPCGSGKKFKKCCRGKGIYD